MRKSSQHSYSKVSSLFLAMAAAMALAGSANAVTTNWIAFNDHIPSAPPGSSPVDWNTAPNVTTYNMRGVAGTTPEPLQGPLTNFITGEGLSAFLAVTANGTPDFFGSISYPSPGTAASNLFHAIVDLGNANSAIGCRKQGGDVPDTGTTLTFSNLDPSKLYVFRGTAVRGNNYLGRWTIASLLGARSFVDAHTTGVYTRDNFPSGTMTNGQASWNSGENRAVGAVVGWVDIQPALDGTFSITCRQYADNPLPNGQPPTLANYGYAFCGIMLAETGQPAPLGISVQPPALVQVEQFRPLSISITTTGSSPVYQWYKGSVATPIAGANRRFFSVSVADFPDTGDYFCIATNSLNSVTSTVAHVNVYADTNLPTVVRAIATSPTTLSVYFSEALGPSVLDPLSSGLDQGLGFTDPVVINTNNPLRVDFNLASPMTLGTLYIYTAMEGSVLDLAGNSIDPTKNTASFRAQFYDGNLDTLRNLPTTGVLALGSLTNRGFDLRLVNFSTNPAAPADFNSLIRIEQILAGTFVTPLPNIATLPCTREHGMINYNKDGPGVSSGRILSDKQYPGFADSPPAPQYAIDNLVIEATCYVELQPGIYRWGVNSDDGFRVTLATSAFDSAFTFGEFNGGRGAADSTFDFNVTQAGLYPIRLIYEEGNGGASVEFWNVDFLVSTNTYVGINDPAGLAAYFPPAPSLTITPSGANEVICWPAANAPYCLQCTDNLTPPITWTDVTAPAARSLAGNCVTVAKGVSKKFYRLTLK